MAEKSYGTIWAITGSRGCSPAHAMQGYGFGRTRSVQLPGGRVKRTKKKVAPEQWYAFIPNAHAGYIGWQEYQENQKKPDVGFVLAAQSVYRASEWGSYPAT
jgi:hypothetical protein